jgi:Tfp pilus assembly protein PilN
MRTQTRIQKTVKGSFQPLGFVVILFLFFVGGAYLYSVNQNAVQGFHMRQLEKEIAALKDENAQLQIKEADQRSLARLEAALQGTSMQKVSAITILRAEETTVALR